MNTTPKELTDRELCRTPTSYWDRRRIEKAVKQAQKAFSRSRRIAEKELEQIFPGISDCRSTVQFAVPPSDRSGNVQPHELIILSTICRYLGPRFVFEFGTFNGLTTLHLALNSPPNSRVVTIDLDPADPQRRIMTDDSYYIKDHSVGTVFRDTSETTKIDQLYGDTNSFDHGQYMGKIDLIFIDAGHEYHLVRSDTEKALEMLAPNGVILWHDYVFTHYGVHTWLNELSQSLPLVSIPNTTLVCYRRTSLPEATINQWQLEVLRDSAEELRQFKESLTFRIAMKMRSLWQVVMPSDTWRERFRQYLLK